MEPNPIAQTAHTIGKLVSRPKALAPGPVPIPKESKSFQTRIPVILGEVHYKGTLAIDGLLGGQFSGSNGSLGVRQQSSPVFASQPELSGDISFRDTVRVNGHIAGTVYSKTGTLIVDTHATVEANVEVAVAVVNGTVHGDIVAQERVEIGPRAKIYGNIWTRSIGMKDGAIFDGVCTMIEDDRNSD
jgi:cytoskeletal protein CcmA (bactofilin family)